MAPPSAGVLAHGVGPPPLVLIIEDEPEIAEVMGIALEDEGYRVDHAGRGRAGLARATARLPNVVLLDLMLPDLHGRDVLRALKASPATSGIPVIIVSAVVGTLTAVDRALVEGIVGKPFEIDVLVGEVRRALRTT